MCKIKEKIKLFRSSHPIKVGNVWEHSFHAEDEGDIISIKIYAKSDVLNSNGLGIVYIIERYMQSSNLVNEIDVDSLFGWVELTKQDFFDQYRY